MALLGLSALPSPATDGSPWRGRTMPGLRPLLPRLVLRVDLLDPNLTPLRLGLPGDLVVRWCGAVSAIPRVRRRRDGSSCNPGVYDSLPRSPIPCMVMLWAWW
jgi:hypothetical protein